MPDFTLERMFEIWSDRDGDKIEVGPDRDSLDLIEIRQKSEKGIILARITMPKEQAALVAKALQACVDEHKSNFHDEEHL